MTNASIQSSFVEAAAASKPKAKPKHLPPFSIRFTEEERAELEQAAGALTLAAYIRLKLFSEDGEPTSPRMKTRKKPSPSIEMTIIGQLLGLLGNARLASNLNQLAKAANIGALPVTPETEKELQETCADVREMRLFLIKAMGIKAEGDDL